MCREHFKTLLILLKCLSIQIFLQLNQRMMSTYTSPLVGTMPAGLCHCHNMCPAVVFDQAAFHGSSEKP